MNEFYSRIVKLNSDICVGVHILMLLLCLERHRSSTVSDERSTREADNLELDGLLAVGRGLGVHDVEGQRIQQVRSWVKVNTYFISVTSENSLQISQVFLIIIAGSTVFLAEFCCRNGQSKMLKNTKNLFVIELPYWWDLHAIQPNVDHVNILHTTNDMVLHLYTTM